MLLGNKGTLLRNKGMLLQGRCLAEVRKKKMPHHGVQHPFFYYINTNTLFSAEVCFILITEFISQ